MSGRRATVVAGAVAALALLLAGSTVWLSGTDQTPTMNARVHDVAAGLRCPTCNAISVADSNSPMSQSMRAQIEDQLRAGRSPEEIRAWFVDRYGQQVLLLPDSAGIGVLLWVLPLAALVVGVGAVVVSRRSGRGSDPQPAESARSALSPRRVAVAAGVFVVAGATVPALLWSAGQPAGTSTAAADERPGGEQQMDTRDLVRVAKSLEEQGDYAAAGEAYREVLKRRPEDVSVRTRLAFVLLRDGRSAEAVSVVQPVANASGRAATARAEALLVLGLAQRAESMPQADDTLRTFLDAAPDHPAARQVRRLVEGER